MLLHKLVVEKKSDADAGIPENKQIIVATKAIKKGEGLAYKKYCEGLKEKLQNK